MASIALRPPRPKMTMSSVQGKIVVVSEDGSRIGQWGGTECFLSWQNALGPCLVVRSSKHRKHEGTFFRLAGLEHVLSPMVSQGKLTVIVPHQQRTCTLFIETTGDVDELRMMAGMLQNRSMWKTMERNVASVNRSGGGSASRGQGDGGSVGPAGDGSNGGGGFVNPSHRVEVEADERYCSSDEEDNEDVSASTNAFAKDKGHRQAFNAISSGGNPRYTQRASDIWTSEQQRASNLCKEGRNVFVTGGAGTGKTEWLLHMLQHVLPRDDEATSGGAPARTVVTASTGIAARAIGGCTVHSFAGVGRGEGSLDTVLSRVRSRADVVRAWRACEVLVIDEISMLPAHVFSMIDAVARAVRGEPAMAFGGIQVIVLGDFLQLPPVSRGDDEVGGAAASGEEAQYAFSSASWGQCAFASVQFSKDYRHIADAELAQCCADVRIGQYTLTVDKVLTACLGRQLDERYGVEATMILSRRRDVDRYNASRLSALEDVRFARYASEDYAAIPGTNIDGEVGLPASLTLKRGAQVVLLASLPGYPGLAKGDLGIVADFASQAHGPELPIVQFISGEEVVIQHVRVEVMGHDGRVSMSRTQIPLQLAWALTVHRVQGMTLPMAKVRLDKSFFESGQAYVALSRVRRAEDLCLESFDPHTLKAAQPQALAFYEKVFPLNASLKLEREARLAQEQPELQERLARFAKRGGKKITASGAAEQNGVAGGKRSRETVEDDADFHQQQQRVSSSLNQPPVSSMASPEGAKPFIAEGDESVEAAGGAGRYTR